MSKLTRFETIFTFLFQLPKFSHIMLFNEVMEVKKIFQHKYLVNILAFIALTMAVVSISAPEIEIYNWKTEQEQKKSRIEADGVNIGGASFSRGCHYATNPMFFAEIAFFLTLFFSLSLTKRIGFSFLLAILFYFQFVMFLELFMIAVEIPMSYFANTPVYSILFVVCVIALSVWQVIVISRFYNRISLGLKNRTRI